jgi:beta-ring hydroxylase
LRKYSVVPSVVRMAAEAVDAEGYHIEKGATVMINIQGTHHDPQFWPEPATFKPERFLNPDTITPYTFIPFVEGPRMCLGQFLSLLESKTVLAYLVHTFRFEVTNKDTAGLKHPFMVPIIPKVGHYMKVH